MAAENVILRFKEDCEAIKEVPAPLTEQEELGLIFCKLGIAHQRFTDSISIVGGGARFMFHEGKFALVEGEDAGRPFGVQRDYSEKG